MITENRFNLQIISFRSVQFSLTQFSRKSFQSRLTKIVPATGFEPGTLPKTYATRALYPHHHANHTEGVENIMHKTNHRRRHMSQGKTT